MGILTACISGHHVYAWCPQKTEKGIDQISETGVIDSWEPLYKC